MEKDYLKEEIMHFLVNVGWTHKIQICQSEVYTEQIKGLKWIKVILTSLTSVGLGSFVLEFFPDFQNISLIITFALSISTTIVLALDKENDYKELSIQNKVASDKYLELREKALELLYELKQGNDSNVIYKNFLELKEIRNQANPDLPYTSSKAVSIASKKIKENRDNDYSKDYEYFIPQNLRTPVDIL